MSLRSDPEYMTLALAEAVAAGEAGEVPIGAVAVANGRIIGRGRNRTIERRSVFAHAEIEALQKAGLTRDDWRMEDMTLYVTKEPCVMCAGALVNARVRRVVYGLADPAAGGFSRFGLHDAPGLLWQIQVESVLSDDCGELLNRFFKLARQRKKFNTPVETGQKYDRIAGWFRDNCPADYGQKYVLDFCAKLPSGAQILELGCGFGRHTRLLLDRGFAVTGLDVSGEMIRLARQHCPEAELICLDALTFDSEQKFDGVLAWDSMFHLNLSQHRRIVKKTAGWLKKDGYLLFTAGDGAPGDTVSGEMGGVSFDYSGLSRAEWVECFKHNHFKQVAVTNDQSDLRHLVITAQKSN